MAFIGIRAKDYKKEHDKTNPGVKVPKKHLPKHVTKGKNPKSRHSPELLARLIYCPRLCQQKDSGAYGRKTYDPLKKHCFGCGATF
jgi:hypothetical protein